MSFNVSLSFEKGLWNNSRHSLFGIIAEARTRWDENLLLALKSYQRNETLERHFEMTRQGISESLGLTIAYHVLH